MSRLKSLKLVLTGFFLAAVMASGASQAKGSAVAVPAASISLSELPRQGLQTYELIHQGGPFAFEKDGVVFVQRGRPAIRPQSANTRH